MNPANNKGNLVPFSWEKKPGVSKLKINHHQEDSIAMSLPLPPCPSDQNQRASTDSNIPLPPLTFQPPLRSSSRKGLMKKQNDDPFLAAYKECTKSTRKPKSRSVGFGFSCKSSSTSVCDDNFVRVSHLPFVGIGERGRRLHR